MAGLAAGSAVLLVPYFGQQAGGGFVLGVGIGMGVAALIAGLVLSGFSQGFTECSPAGIRTRGLGGKHQCAWEEVAKIAVRHSGGRYLRGAPTLSVTVFTTTGRFGLGAPVSGGVAPDPGFEARARQIRDYWQTAIGSAATPDPSSPLPIDYLPADVPPAIDLASMAVLLVLSAAIAAPIALARGGAAVLARLGQGQPGYFTGYGRICTSACYWIGRFTAIHGARRDGMLMAQGGSGTRIGGKIPAVFAGNAPLTYPAGGGTAWIPPAITVAFLIVCLPVAVVAIARYRRQLADMRRGRNPLRGRQLRREQRLAADPSTMLAKIRRRTAMTLAIIVAVVLTEWLALIAAVGAIPSSPPSAAQIACADYTSWNPDDTADRVTPALARALDEAPPGRLAVDLGVLSGDVQTAIAERGTKTGVLAEASVVQDQGQVNKDCSAAGY